MTETGSKDWLSALPMVGYEVEILLKTGHKIQIPFARISADGQMVHVGIIQNAIDRNSYPAIIQTIQIIETDICEISFKVEKEYPKIRTFRRPIGQTIAQSAEEKTDTAWLRDLPKSRKCRIFLFCSNRDNSKEVHKGWVEYDSRKIYLTEIIREKTVLEVERHDRDLNDVVAILITVDGQTPQVFVRTIKT